MATKVFDASAVAAFVFGEPEAARMRDLLRSGPRPSSVLLQYEIANICATKMRRSPAEANVMRRAFALFEELGFQHVPVEMAACLDLARRTGLTAYDASYLWLARLLEVELVTLDKRLARPAAG